MTKFTNFAGCQGCVKENRFELLWFLSTGLDVRNLCHHGNSVTLDLLSVPHS